MKNIAYQQMYENEMSHAWYITTRRLMLGYLKRNLKKDAKILDAGCGTGGTIKYLANAGFKNVQGIDNSPEALKFCRKRGVRNVKPGSVNHLPFKNQTFDAVICLDVLYHKEVIPSKALAEFKQVLKTGGTLYLQEPAYNWLRSSHDLAIETSHRFSDCEIKEVLDKNNFEIVKFTHFNFLLFLPIVIKRLSQKIIKPKLIETDIKHLTPAINLIILKVLNFESFLIKRINWPFGLSIICVAKK